MAGTEMKLCNYKKAKKLVTNDSGYEKGEKVKWHIGDKAIIDIDGMIGSLVVWGIAPEPKEESEKYFGVVSIDNNYDILGNLIRQPGDSFNAHYSEIKKPEEYAPEHINTRNCWCGPELEYEDPETGNQVWVHRDK